MRQRYNQSRVALPNKCRSTCGSAGMGVSWRGAAAAIMSKDKRGFGERSTNQARIAPKLHKRLCRCRAAYEVSI